MNTSVKSAFIVWLILLFLCVWQKLLSNQYQWHFVLYFSLYTSLLNTFFFPFSYILLLKVYKTRTRMILLNHCEFFLLVSEGKWAHRHDIPSQEEFDLVHRAVLINTTQVIYSQGVSMCPVNFCFHILCKFTSVYVLCFRRFCLRVFFLIQCVSRRRGRRLTEGHLDRTHWWSQL